MMRSRRRLEPMRSNPSTRVEELGAIQSPSIRGDTTRRRPKPGQVRCCAAASRPYFRLPARERRFRHWGQRWLALEIGFQIVDDELAHLVTRVH